MSLSSKMQSAFAANQKKFEDSRANSGSKPFPPPGDHQVYVRGITLTDENVVMRNGGTPSAEIPAIQITFDYEMLEDTDGLGKFSGTNFYIPIEGPGKLLGTIADMYDRNTLGRLKQHLKIILGLAEAPDNILKGIQDAQTEIERAAPVVLLRAEHREDLKEKKAGKPNPRVYKTDWLIESLSAQTS